MRYNRLMAAALIFLLSNTLKVHGEDVPLTLVDRAKMGEVYSLEKLKKYPEAKPMIIDLHQKYPGNQEVKWTYARIMGFGGNWKESVAFFNELCAKNCDKDMLMTYAHILEAQGPNPETPIYIKKLADLHPNDEKIQSIYGEILSWCTQMPGGRQVLEQLRNKYPNDLRILEALGDMAYTAKDYSTAQDDFERILKSQPSNRVRQKYALVLVGQRKYKEAIAQMNQLISSAPHDLELRYQYAQVISATGDHALAVKELQSLIGDGFSNKEASVMLGDELRAIGHDDEAIKVYQGVANEK